MPCLYLRFVSLFSAYAKARTTLFSRKEDDEDLIPLNTTITTTTSSTSLADQERDKHKNSKFKRHIMVIEINKHIKLLQDEGRFKIRRMHKDDVLLAALYYKMKPP